MLLAVVHFFFDQDTNASSSDNKDVEKTPTKVPWSLVFRAVDGAFFSGKKQGLPGFFDHEKLTKQHGVVKLTRGEDMYIKVPNETWLFLGRWVMIFGETFV